MLKQIVIALFALYLSLFLFMLAWRILALLRLLPCVLFFTTSRLLFPEWSSANPVLCWGIVAALGIVGLLSRILPKVLEWRSNRRMEQNLAEQISYATERGIPLEDLTIEVIEGVPMVVYQIRP